MVEMYARTVEIGTFEVSVEINSDLTASRTLILDVSHKLLARSRSIDVSNQLDVLKIGLISKSERSSNPAHHTPKSNFHTRQVLFCRLRVRFPLTVQRS
jgi:hypothetical protein